MRKSRIKFLFYSIANTSFQCGQKSVFLRLGLASMALSVFACAPAYQSSVVKTQTAQEGNTNGQNPTPPEGVYQKPLTPTYSYGPGFDIPENVKKSFDPMPTEIKTKTAVVHLGQTHFQNVQYLYDFKNKKIKITGHLQIIDQQGKTIFTENDFEISGVHNAISPVVLLQPVANQNNDSKDNAAIIKAKVTCLGIYEGNAGPEDDQISCDKAVVDFFVSYNKQYLTDQFETKSEPVKKQTPAPEQKPKNSGEGVSQTNPLTQKSVPASQDSTYNEVSKTASSDTTQSKNSPTDAAENKDDEHEFEPEGSDGSINSRYQGQVENTDVVALFNDNNDNTAAETTTTPPKAVPSASNPTVKNPPTVSEKNSGDKTTAAKDKKTEDKNKPDQKSQLSSQDATKVEDKPVAENQSSKTINANIEETADGKLRPYNQAVGYPDDGRLRNATNLKDQQASQKEQGLYVILSSKQRYYATFEMSEFISGLAKFLTNEESTRLYVGNISAQKGGHISPHQSHQIGMDADFGYPTVHSRTSFPVVARAGNINKAAYSVERTFESFKFAFKQRHAPVEKIFVDQLIINDLCHYAKSKNEFNGKDAQIVKTLFQNIQHVDGHGNHYHVRLKCTPSQPACRSKQYRRVNNCQG